MGIKHERKWQITAIVIISLWLMGITVLHLSANYEIDTIVIVDLGLGIVSLILAMYVYNKEKRLEARIDNITTNKIHNAHVDILTNLVIFGRTLDNLFITTHKENDTHITVNDADTFKRLHSSLKMVFAAHIDVMDKNVMGHLAQHISILEQYVDGTVMKILEHMDNMHDMDKLTNILVAHMDKGGADYIAKEWPDYHIMRKRRENHFMMYSLEKMREFVIHPPSAESQQEIRRKIIVYQNVLLYHIGDNNALLKNIISKMAELSPIWEHSSDRTLDMQKTEYADALNSIISGLRDADRKIDDDQLCWVDIIADYCAIKDPLEFLIRTINILDSDSPWTHLVDFRIQSILEIIRLECSHMPNENRRHIDASLNAINFDGTKDECLEKLIDVKKYLMLQESIIKKEHNA